MAEKKRELEIGGYTFATEELAAEAKDELNAIKYVSAKTNTSDPAQVFVLYNKIIEKKLFKTQIGMDYLKELQRFLYISKEIPNNKIKPIPVEPSLQDELDQRAAARANKDTIRSLQRANKQYQQRFVKSMILNVILVIAVVAMIFIAMTSSNPNILNYENKIIDKYQDWSNELESKEKELEEWESKLYEQSGKQ